MTVEADRAEIVELTHRYAAICDLKQYDQVARVFSPDATIDFSALRSYVGHDTGATGHADIRRFLERFTSGRVCMHFLANHVVELGGDHAVVRAHMHNLNSSICGFYHAQAVRSTDGWRLKMLRLEPLSIDADRIPVLPEHARPPA